MEEYTQYRIWTNTKHLLRSDFPSSMRSFHSSSWEEQAFQQDMIRAPFGGFTWPPRSYPCSFCNREFRSAQALGGHMNVHRRDRAKLKQFPPENQVLPSKNKLHQPGEDNRMERKHEFLGHGLELSFRLNQADYETAPNGSEVHHDKVKFKRTCVTTLKCFQRHSLSPDVLGMRASNSMEDIDLELRLGDPPAVK